MPPVLSLKLYTTNIKVDYKIRLHDNEDIPHTYILQGIVYFGGSHFVSRIVDKNCDVWYNDGIATEREYIREKSIREFSSAEIHSITINRTIYHSSYAIYRKD